jgi:hypothetical protein
MKAPTILIIDDDVHAELYEFWLPDHHTVRTVTSERATLSAIDRTVAVAVLRHELPTDAKTKIESRLAASSPSSKLLLTTSAHTPAVFPDVDADESLHEPITEEDLVETVERLLKRALYHEGLRQYYRSSMERVNTRYEQSEDSDAAERQDELETRLAKLTVFLDEMASKLDADDVDAVLDALRGSVKFERNREGSECRTVTAKHRPDKCGNCGLVWGRDYGNGLGSGYTSLGAFTWRCRECGEVQNIPSPTDRSVARR